VRSSKLASGSVSRISYPQRFESLLLIIWFGGNHLWPLSGRCPDSNNSSLAHNRIQSANRVQNHSQDRMRSRRTGLS